MFWKYYFITAFVGLVLASFASGATEGQNYKFDYYVNSVNGSDQNDGSLDAPWQTVTKALTATGRVGFFSGFYGSISETTDAQRTGRLTLKAVPGNYVYTPSIYLNYDNPTLAALRVEGFEVTSNNSNMVYLKNAFGVHIERCTIHAEKWAIKGKGRDAFEILNCSNILIRGNRVYEVNRGITTSNTTSLTVANNYFRTKAGTCIQYAGGCAYALIENNHFSGDDYVGYPDNPDAPENPHSSLISIRSNDITIRNNHMTGRGRIGNSSAIMCYNKDAAGGEDAYSNILIENNVIYNTINTYSLRIYNLGTNFVIRNNLIFSKVKDGTCNGSSSDQRYRYSVALQVHSHAPGYDGSGLELYNNIFIGTVGASTTVKEYNNIVWSWKSGSWLSTSPSGTSYIAVSTWGGCGNYSNIFESGFFKDNIDLWFTVDDAVDWSLDDLSMGVNFGDPAYQPSDSLGSIGAYGFLRMNGPPRSSTVHSVGPLEN
jgi:hypothetical protein